MLTLVLGQMEKGGYEGFCRYTYRFLIDMNIGVGMVTDRLLYGHPENT